MSILTMDLHVRRRVKQARCRHLSMTALRAANFLEISVADFVRMENGTLRPTGEQLVLLADLMSVEPSWFFTD